MLLDLLLVERDTYSIIILCLAVFPQHCLADLCLWQKSRLFFVKYHIVLYSVTITSFTQLFPCWLTFGRLSPVSTIINNFAVNITGSPGYLQMLSQKHHNEDLLCPGVWRCWTFNRYFQIAEWYKQANFFTYLPILIITFHNLCHFKDFAFGFCLVLVKNGHCFSFVYKNMLMFA